VTQVDGSVKAGIILCKQKAEIGFKDRLRLVEVYSIHTDSFNILLGANKGKDTYMQII
jgi:hypothetical protein